MRLQGRSRHRVTPPPWGQWTLLFVSVAAWAWCGPAHGAEEPVTLTILPTSALQVKSEGRNALLTCRPVGTGAGLVTGLRWRAPDGREVPQPLATQVSKPPVFAERFSADGSLSLIFQSLQRHDEGNYTCEGQYAGGQDLARSVEIRVIKAIRFVEAPTEQYARRGEDFKVMCKVEAEPPATVDWQKDGAPLPPGDRLRQETDGLVIPDASPADDGVYTCRAIVVATGELQTLPIKVEVQVPPTFVEDRREVSVKADRDQTIECHAEGRPPPDYTWIKDATGSDLGKAGGRFKVNSITGALHLSPARGEDDGEYWCVASNRASEARQAVRVRVLVPPRVTIVRNVTATAGAPSEIQCHAHGRPLPSVSWRRHGQDDMLSPGQQASDKRIATSSRPAGKDHPDRSDGVLSWDEVQRSDDGLYACVAHNEAGTAQAYGHLTVQFAPSFANTPYAEYWSWDGKIANITCLAESIPNATIRWFFNNRDIEKDKLTMFKKYGTGPQSWLEIDANFPNRYATYKCLAKNTIGETEHEIILHKAVKPGNINQVVIDKVTATTIKFKILGPSENGGILTHLYNVRYRRRDDLGSQWMTHSWTAESDYTLTNLEPLTRYEFQFSAQNEVGEGPWGATQSVVMPKRSPPEPPPLLDRVPMAKHPDKPIDTPVLSAYPTHFELRWNIPADNGEPILNYIVSWCPARQNGEGHWEQDKRTNYCQERTLLANPHTTTFRLQPLQPSSQYMIHLHAKNNIGISKPSMLLLKTAPGAPRPNQGSSFPGNSEASPATTMSSAALVAAVVSALLVALLLLDVACFACRRAGVIAALCERARTKQALDGCGTGEPGVVASGGLRIGASHSKEPLRDEMRPLTPNYAPSVKRDTSVGFDGKTTAVTRSTFVGKDSAV